MLILMLMLGMIYHQIFQEIHLMDGWNCTRGADWLIAPNSAKEKIRQKTALFDQTTLISALFDPFLLKIFQLFPAKEEGGLLLPISAKVFFWQNVFPVGGGVPTSSSSNPLSSF